MATIEITERIISYKQAQLEAWVLGDKSMAPPFFTVPPILHNQPRYHFAETLVLRHYYETEGWRGFTSYALGPQYPRSERRKAGRRKIEAVIPPERLLRLRELRSDPNTTRTGGGEPDVFLYHPDGRFKFAEVKKARDRLRASQLTCIAQILDVLGCEVDIVYVRAERQVYSPKTYRFDLASHTGERAA